MSTSDHTKNSPREIEYENDLIDLDYLQEKFDEDDAIPKEIDEEIHLTKGQGLASRNDNQDPPRTVKEEIANIKAKAKSKQQNTSSDSQSLNVLNTNNPLAPATDSVKEYRLPSVSKKTSSARSKVSSHDPPSSHQPPGPRDKSQETKFPHLSNQRNKPLPPPSHGEGPSQKSSSSLFKKRSKDSSSSAAVAHSGLSARGKGRGTSEEEYGQEEDDLKSMEILKRREEEILRAKAKREKLLGLGLGEQTDYILPSELDQMSKGGLPVATSSASSFSHKKRTKKKKETKDVSPLLLFDSPSFPLLFSPCCSFW
jgi:hypothetical protein